MIQGLMEGIVVDTNDPQQMGRVKAWVPAIDGDLYEIAERRAGEAANRNRAALAAEQDRLRRTA